MKRLKTIFMGTPDFSLPSLDLLNNHPHIDLIHIVSSPSKAVGRGQKIVNPPVVEYAKLNKIKCLQTANINKEKEFTKQMEDNRPDLIIVLAYGQFLGKRILDLPKIGPFNIHTSLLPKFRGAAPIQHAILKGETETGVTIQKMVKEMDAGDVVHSHKVSISNTETGGLLYTRLKFQAALSLNSFIHDLIDNNINYIQQDDQLVSFAPSLKREDGYLKFENETVEDIINKTRGLFPWPGTYCFLNKKRLKIFRVQKEKGELAAGKLKLDFGTLLVGCLNGTVRLIEVQLEGKKRCIDEELLNGIREKIVIH